jgi:hypothetical protein
MGKVTCVKLDAGLFVPSRLQIKTGYEIACLTIYAHDAHQLNTCKLGVTLTICTKSWFRVMQGPRCIGHQ